MAILSSSSCLSHLSNQIATVDLEGNIRVLTNSPFDHEHPRYTPDGKFIVYQRDDEDGYNQIFILPAEGGEEKQITYDNYDHELPFPYFSYKEGKKILSIAYQKEDGTGFYQIYKLSFEEGSIVDIPLTREDAEHEYPYPIFLPTMKTGFITYQKIGEEDCYQIWKVPDDGSGNEIPLTRDFLTDYERPVFSPNGQWVCATRWLVPTSEIVEIDSTGKIYSLTDNLNIRDCPQYSPLGDAITCSFEVGTPEGDGGQGRETGLAKGFFLYPNYPNPFNSQTSLKYQIPYSCKVSLDIYNTAGRFVRRIVNEEQKAGIYDYTWDGKDDKGKDLPQGVYFYRLKVKGFEDIKKTVLLR
ncbi:MAG: FlgD immunoglobulin-like domain containing protein [candidate division WOR-3 bacterium]